MAKQLDAIKLTKANRPPGGYLYPERVGNRWDVTKKFHYSYGVPAEVMSQWAPYVIGAMEQLKDEDANLPGFQDDCGRTPLYAGSETA